MTWYYNDVELSDDDIPNKAFGFIYIITHLPSGKRYIGRKLLTKSHRRQKNKKIIKSRVENDWRDYWSSSPELLELIEIEGKTNFKREILCFADTRGQLNYLEEKFQYSLGVLESEAWFNSNIRSKMFKKNLLNKMDFSRIESIINILKKE